MPKKNALLAALVAGTALFAPLTQSCDSPPHKREPKPPYVIGGEVYHPVVWREGAAYPESVRDKDGHVYGLDVHMQPQYVNIGNSVYIHIVIAGKDGYIRVDARLPKK